MPPGSYMNPRTCALPFEMFRSFGPKLDKEWRTATSNSRGELEQENNELIFMIGTWEMKMNPDSQQPEFLGLPST